MSGRLGFDITNFKSIVKLAPLLGIGFLATDCFFSV